MFELSDYFVVPVDGIDCLVGVHPSNVGLIGTIAVVDGQNSETTIERLAPNDGIATRNRLTVASPFYFQSRVRGPLLYIAAGQLHLTGSDKVWDAAIDPWCVGAACCTGAFAFINRPGDSLIRTNLSTGELEHRDSSDESFAMDLSADDRFLAIAANEAGATVCVYAVGSFDRVEEIGLDVFAYQAHFTRDARRLLISHATGVVLYDRKTGVASELLRTEREVISCSLSPDENLLAVAEPSADGSSLLVLNVSDGRVVERHDLAALREFATWSGSQRGRLNEILGEAPEFGFSDSTEAGSGVSFVEWRDEGLTVATFHGEVWVLSAESTQ